MNLKTLLVGVAVAIPTLMGCGGGGNHHIAIEISTPPPASLTVNQTAMITATVANDHSNMGVDWSCAPAGSCGTFAPAHTASGGTTVYTAPAAAASVTITAASTKQPSITAVASVAVNAAAAIAIQFTTAPASSLRVNQTTSVSATVTNDPANMGVDWSCTPTPAATCGTFTPAHTASGAATVYTAPAAAVTPVVITAAATSKPSVTATASVTITAGSSTADLTGTYTFFANGYDNNQQPYSVTGSVVLNGLAGTVTGGEQDYFDLFSGNTFASDPITTGTISIGIDGRGTITLHPTSTPVETFSVTVVNSKHVLITQFDSNATASGSLDLQTAPTSVPTGGNAFAVFDSADAVVFGGVFTSDGTNTITTGQADDDLGGTPDFNFAITGSFTAPDAAGRGTITINDPKTTPAFEFAYYVVGPEAFRLIEIDGVGFATGSMFGQGSGSFSGTGKFVFGESGVVNPANTSSIGVYGISGQFTGNGTTGLSAGVADVNLGDGTPKLAGSLTGSGTNYFVNTNGYGGLTLSGSNTDGLAEFGIYSVDPTVNVTDPNSVTGGGGGLMLNLDANTLGAGIVVPQATPAVFVGNYAFSQAGGFQSNTAVSPFGLVGQVLSSGSSLSGLADDNEINSTGLNAGASVSGTIMPDAANPGRLTAVVTITGRPGPNNLTIYQASSALLLHVDVDSTAPTLGTVGTGVFELQLP